MDILETIVAHKQKEVAQRKQEQPVSVLEQSYFFHLPTLSMKEFLLDDQKTGIITEFKRQSPSKGVINDKADVAGVTRAYTAHGASALSVLTDSKFFGGATSDLLAARTNRLPILRKDFMIDEYQLLEAKSMGADTILLIAANLSPKRVKELARFAKNLGLGVLLELHANEELEHICDETELVGINNRNLKTFEVDIERSLQMAEQIPGDKIKIAESGISNIDTIQLFKKHGFRGFLMGENFMKASDPGLAFAKFAASLQSVQA